MAGERVLDTPCVIQQALHRVVESPVTATAHAVPSCSWGLHDVNIPTVSTTTTDYIYV